MNRLVSVVLAVMASVHLTAQSCPPADAGKVPIGALVVNETNHDFGEILRGETVSHTFTLTNASTSDFTLFEIRVCCTCVAAAMTIGGRAMNPSETAECKLLGTLKKGEHAEVTVTVDTLDDGCGTKDGILSKSVRVYFSDRSVSPLTLSVRGDLVTPYTIEPSGLRFGAVKQGTSVATSCVLTATRLGDFKITRVRLSADFIKAAVEPVPISPTTSGVFRITANLLPSAPIANYQERVVLELDHPRVRAIVVPLSLVVESPGKGRAPQ